MISVVIPVYNVEKYIDECIQSVVNQTYRDLEIILVDDGSTDTSGKLCDDWATRDERICVFHKSNGGLMSAWKYGVCNAKGDYVGFVDSDDWIDSDMYEVLLKRITETQSDIALCGLVKNFENDQSKADEIESILLDEDFYDRTSILEKIYPIAICSGSTISRGISPNRVTKLYKRELILQVVNDCPDNVSIGEDLVSTVSALTKCNSLCVIKNFAPYHYRINSSSMTQKYSSAKYEKIKNLNMALNSIDDKTGSNFADQIANDYITLIFENIEQEILLSGYSFKKIRSDIKNETLSPIFIESSKKANKKKYNKKIRLYTFLSKLHLWGTIILIRRLYSLL